MTRAITRTLLATLFVASMTFAARAQSAQQKDEPPPPRPVAPPAPAGATPDPGRVEGGTYSNDFFGFSMTLPKGWVVLDADDNKKIMDAGKGLVEEGASELKKKGVEAAIVRTHFLVTASKFPAGTPGPGFNAFLICIAERIPTAVIKTEAEYVSAMQRPFDGTSTKMELSSPLRTQKVGGADFTVADMKMTVGPVVTAQRYYVRITKGYALVAAYTYFDDADLKTFEEMMGSVKFK